MSIEQFIEDLETKVDTKHCTARKFHDFRTGYMCPISQVALENKIVSKVAIEKADSSLSNEREMLACVSHYYGIASDKLEFFYRTFDNYYYRDWKMDEALNKTTRDLKASTP